MQVTGPIGQGPLQGPSSSDSGLAGDIFVGLVQGAIFLVIGILVLALVTYGLAYVAVHAIGFTGLLDAWAGLVVLTVSDGFSAPLVLESVLFGAIVGVLLALAQFRHRWRQHHHEWIVEALVSPDTLTAVRYGLVCVVLNVVISMLAAWIVSQLGVQFPWPTALGGHGAAVLITGAMAGGGGAGGGGWDPESFLMGLVFLTCFISIAVAIVVALSWSGLGWLLVQSAPSATALHAMGAAAARGAVYGGSLATTGALMQLALTGRLASNPHYIRNEAWFFPALFNGLAIGAANAALMGIIVMAGAALFGLTAAAR